jgi:hypothetical protein
MAYNVESGQIQSGVLYRVFGIAGTINYNGVVYTSGSAFRGITGIVDFAATNNATVQEVLELFGGSGELLTSINDLPPHFPEVLNLMGTAAEFEMAPAESVFNDAIRLQGASIEFTDSPYYSFQITETRL